MERKYKTLADVYADILKGHIDVEHAFVVADGGDFSVYEHGACIFECSERDAMEFISDILGLTWQEP